jgi:hypothetical protein
MRIARPTLYVAVGMVLGVAGSLVAQQPVVQRTGATGERLTSVSVGSIASRPTFFVRDSSSGGCWIVVGWTTGDANPSVAVAPPDACKQ